jgi:hypothetical protein
MGNIYAKLISVQNELKAPKSQYNSFGKYSYRNQEDILEAVKPLLLKHNLSLFLKDEITLIGDRYYLKATCILIDTETSETVENTALARESESKKGMDDSQVTGSTSSYARKYALNGLFLIDDTKDADYSPQNEKQSNGGQTQQQQGQQKKPQQQNSGGNKTISDNQLKLLNTLISRMVKEKNLDREVVLDTLRKKQGVGAFESTKDLKIGQASKAIAILKENLGDE